MEKGRWRWGEGKVEEGGGAGVCGWVGRWVGVHVIGIVFPFNILVSRPDHTSHEEMDW